MLNKLLRRSSPRTPNILLRIQHIHPLRIVRLEVPQHRRTAGVIAQLLPIESVHGLRVALLGAAQRAGGLHIIAQFLPVERARLLRGADSLAVQVARRGEFCLAQHGLVLDCLLAEGAGVGWSLLAHCRLATQCCQAEAAFVGEQYVACVLSLPGNWRGEDDSTASKVMA